MYGVKILHPDGTIKQEISSEAVTRQYWEKYNDIRLPITSKNKEVKTAFCSICEESFLQVDKRSKTCSEDCRRDRNTKLARKRKPMVDLTRKCVECPTVFTPKYHQIIACSEKCNNIRKKKIQVARTRRTTLRLAEKRKRNKQ